MGKDLIKTFGHAGIYTFGVLLNRAVSFVMLPIYTRYLSPADYGTLELLEVTVDVVSIIAGMGILQGLFKFYAEYEREEDRKQLVSTLFIMIILSYACGCVISFAISPSISSLIFGTTGYRDYILLSFANLFLSFLIYVPLAFIQVQKKSGHFVIINALKLAIQLFLNILFVVYLGKGVLGVLYSTFIASVITGIVLATYTFSKVRFRFSREMAGKLLKFGYPFVFSGLGAFILTYSDRYFLKHYAQLSSVGIYSLGYKFGFLLAMFPVRPLFNIWMVQRFEIINQKNYEKTFNQFLSWFVIITLSVGLVISLFSGDVLKVMAAPSFWGAYKIVPIIVLAYFFQACTDYFNFGILYSGRTSHMAYGTLLSAVVIIILSFLLIPRYGMFGAAWATLISFFVRLSYVYAVSQRLFRIHHALAKPIGTLIIMLSIVAVYSISLTHPFFDKSIFSFSLAVFLLLVFYLLLFSFDIIGTEEKRIIRSFLRAPLKTLGETKSSET